MRFFSILQIGLLVGLASAPATGQHQLSNWVSRKSTDTTVVPCWSDPLSSIAFPPESMMMMMPDSFFCRIDRMSLDSLKLPHDSTVIGWYRVRVGRDSVHFDLMQPEPGNGYQQMLQFMTPIACRFHRDSLAPDSAHRGWHLTGAEVWDGITWIPVANASMIGNEAFFTSRVLYTVIALTGIPPGVSGIADSRPQIQK